MFSLYIVVSQNPNLGTRTQISAMPRLLWCWLMWRWFDALICWISEFQVVIHPYIRLWSDAVLSPLGSKTHFSIRLAFQIVTAAPQKFKIDILPVDDGTPRIVTNLGLQWLEYMDNKVLLLVKASWSFVCLLWLTFVFRCKGIIALLSSPIKTFKCLNEELRFYGVAFMDFLPKRWK